MRSSRSVLRSGRALQREGASRAPKSKDWLIESTVVAYILLWGFEGAIRKWVPGTETVLYVARDALLLGVFVWLTVTTKNKRANSAWFWAFSLLFMFLGGIHIIQGISAPVTAVNGARAFIAPLMLLAFVQVFRTERLVKLMLAAVVAVAIANVPITMLQVLSAPDAFINKDVGSDVAGFVNTGGIVRPSGTFSAPAGFAAMIPVTLAASLAALMLKSLPRWLCASSLVGVLLMASLSGARSAALGAIAVLVAYAWIQLRQGKASALVSLAISGATLWLVYEVATGLFPQVLQSFSDRIAQASAAEDAGSRLLESSLGFLSLAAEPLGSGLGQLSSAAILTGNSQQWVETENGRWVAEIGVLGVLLAVTRLVAGVVALAILVVGDVRQSPHQRIFVGVLALQLLVGSVNQIPSHQGAFAIVVALVLLCAGQSKDSEPDIETATQRSARRIGRSRELRTSRSRRRVRLEIS